ncbi:hypothetical protein CH296_00290 [Rhodococcus sp. 14-2496-1d]|nr:hypothetical protein CH296_00290 [Rhodococcus sp. 14-2496-1d]
MVDGARSTVSGGCEGKGGYDDLAEGASVTVSDASGTTVATGNINDSTYIDGACLLSFAFDVPAGSDFYKVEVSHRGEVTYPADQARSGVFMTIGG